MARKSRKIKNSEPLPIEATPNMEVLSTGAYIRLSVENGGHETDDSLRTQQKLVEDFIKANPELKLTDVYADNGYSGTDFGRPEFIRLMEDVRSGRIQCIVVKDLSRFGRDYLETGYYLETIFPKLNVRFIAVTDNFDNTRQEDRESLAVPIKNLVNELYAKDMSRKILASKEAQKLKGNVIVTKAPFGYVIGEDKRHFEVDEETAPYVRMMFQWTMLGVGKTEIANRLNLLRIATPGQRDRLGVLKVEAGEEKWTAGTIQSLLGNPNYCGDLVTGRLKQSLYKGLKQYKTSPEDWIVQKDKHEPMIARDDYEELEEKKKEISQECKKLKAKHRAEREKYKDCFPGMIRCADCGSTMYYMRHIHNYATNEKAGSYYVCPEKNTLDGCSRHRVEENLLKIVVMDQIQNLIKSMCSRKKLIQKLSTDTGVKSVYRESSVKIRSLERNIMQLEERNTSLYMDYTEGIVEAEDFQYMKEQNILNLQKMR